MDAPAPWKSVSIVGNIAGWMIRMRPWSDRNHAGVDFEVLEIVGVCDDGQLVFLRADAAGSDDTTEDEDQANMQMSGLVKWDGSLSLAFHESISLDWRRGVREFSTLLERILEMADAMLSNPEYRRALEES